MLLGARVLDWPITNSTQGRDLNEITPGQSFGDYEILGVAGTGGMGIVYRARQKSLDRVVALKVILPQIAEEEEFRERFLREARLASSIDHPNIVAIYDAGEIDGRLYLSMQWIEGEDLQHIVASGGALTPSRAREISGQVAMAIDTVHAAGLLHRDIKPANVLIRRVSGKDHAYLTDFGIARNNEADGLTKTGQSIGTPGFTAPEQLRGEKPTAASDLYALAYVSFELFAGRPPFVGENAIALQWANANEARPIASVVNSDLDDRYDEFFVRALAIDPSVRFATGSQYVENLGRAQSREPLSAPGTTIGGAQIGGDGHPATVIDRQQPADARQRAWATPVTISAAASVRPDSKDPARKSGGSFAAIIALALIAVVGITVGALVATGLFDGKDASASQELAAAKKSAAAHKRKTEVAEAKLRATQAKARREGAPSGGGSSCTDFTAQNSDGGTFEATNISTANTSCDEARSTISAGPSGRADRGWSCPVTGDKTFTSCTKGAQRLSWHIPSGTSPPSGNSGGSSGCSSFQASGGFYAYDISLSGASCSEAHEMINAGPSGRVDRGWKCPLTGDESFTSCTRSGESVSWHIR